MCGVRRRVGPQDFIVGSLILHFCKTLFPSFEPVTSLSRGGNFTNYAKASVTLVEQVFRLHTHNKNNYVSFIMLQYLLDNKESILRMKVSEVKTYSS